MTDDSQPYELAPVGTADGSLEIPAGTSLLVTAPESAGREFIVSQLRHGLQRGESGLLITTDEPAATLRESVEAGQGIDRADTNDLLRIIDCQTDHPGMGPDNNTVVQNVNTPRNLTDIGIGFKNAFDQFETTGHRRVRFGLLSLSVVLSYVDRETAYRFCQTLTRGLAQESALGLFSLSVDAHDERTINTLRRAFDGTVEIEGGDGETTPEVRGVDGVDNWTYHH